MGKGKSKDLRAALEMLLANTGGGEEAVCTYDYVLCVPYMAHVKQVCYGNGEYNKNTIIYRGLSWYESTRQATEIVFCGCACMWVKVYV